MRRIVSMVIILLVIAALVLGIVFSRKDSKKETTGTYQNNVQTIDAIG